MRSRPRAAAGRARPTAGEVAVILKFEATTVKEGEEPDEFWAAVGGKGRLPLTYSSNAIE